MQAQFPSTLVDVMPLGHCMYGCDSCSVREHQIPLFFTRFFTKYGPCLARTASAILPRRDLLTRCRSALVGLSPKDSSLHQRRPLGQVRPHRCP
jgi:hypothetical protein